MELKQIQSKYNSMGRKDQPEAFYWTGQADPNKFGPCENVVTLLITTTLKPLHLLIVLINGISEKFIPSILSLNKFSRIPAF